MNKKSLTSIIIPCYNARKYIVDTIKSILQQTHSPIEIIVIDDGSTDGSLKVIKNYEEKVKWSTGPNRGACQARNQGFEMASGEYVMFLDADDLVAPKTLEALQSKLLATNKKIAVCPWSKLVYSKKGGWQEKEGLPLTPREGQDWLQSWLTGRFIPSCSILWHRSDLEQLGGWDESLSANQDGDLVMRFLLNEGGIVTTYEGQSFYRQHEGLEASISNRYTKSSIESRAKVIGKVQKELMRQQKLNKYRNEIAVNFQGFAILAYYIDEWELGQKYEIKARELAGRWIRNGSLSHKIISSLLGLEKKERLVRVLNKIGLGTDRKQFKMSKTI